MSEETDLHSPPEASPFEEQPRDPAALKGCSKPALTGCAVTLLVFAVALLILMAKSKDMFVWAMNTNAEQILSKLPPEVTPEEAERLRRGFDAASAAVIEGRINLDGIRDIQRVAGLAARPSLTRDEVLEAIAALERVAALPAPDGTAAMPRRELPLFA